ncbi:MAG: hypothetical protein LBU40_05850 [Methanobrevibacter sp.]|jgi:hypothetical protein|nr:hypothetical protein [Methanobrevibacter sp.]
MKSGTPTFIYGTYMFEKSEVTIYKLRKSQYNNTINSKLSKQVINNGIVWDTLKHISPTMLKTS